MISSLLFPQQNVCHLCMRYLEAPGYLCPACEAELRQMRLASPLRRLPPLEDCASVYRHDGPARELIHLLKYRSDCVLAEPLGEAMALLAPRLGLVDCVIPVPMHAARLRKRGYNQAELLARSFCSHSGLWMETDLLVRQRSTASQVGRNREERLQAMRGAFAVTDPMAAFGQRFLLVDDVLTTGSTAIACAEALLIAGAQAVSLITVCRA